MVATSDRLLLNRESGRQRALGSLVPGALYVSTIEQLLIILQAVEREDLLGIRTLADAERARESGKPGLLLGCEGADVLEGNLDRLQELHTTGVRLMQLVHYRVNELGDIQPEDPAGIRGAPPYRRFEQFPALVQMLQSRGLGNDDVAKVAGGNFMRLYGAVAGNGWFVALPRR
jgi:microsomal dipeptidase-like Zn-dependent dipeptidase